MYLNPKFILITRKVVKMAKTLIIFILVVLALAVSVSSVIGAPTCSITANPTTINSGQSSVLTMTVTGTATSATLDSTSVAVTGGTKTESPTITTTFSGTITSAAGSNNCQAIVTVNAAGGGSGDLVCNIRTNTCNTGEFVVLKFASGQASIPDAANTYTNIACCKSNSGAVTGITKLTGASLDTSKGYIRLSADTNAHAELFNAPTPVYTTLLKFQSTNTVTCASKTVCDANDICLFSISADTNAHIGDCNAFPQRRICCLSEVVSVCTLTKAEWRKQNNNIITDQQQITDGSTLKLYVEAAGACDNKKTNLRLILKHKGNGFKTKMADFPKSNKLKTFLQVNYNINLDTNDNEATVATKLSFPIETNTFQQSGSIFTASAEYTARIINAPRDNNPDLDVELAFLKFEAFASPGIESQDVEVTNGGGSGQTCSSPSDCASNRCISGICQACTATSCTLISKKCKNPPGNCVQCLDTSDCEQGLICSPNDNNNNVCQNCGAGITCPAGQQCNIFGKCELITQTGCTSDSQCPNGKCISGVCQIIPPTPPAGSNIQQTQFPIYDWFNAIISILMLFGYYLKRKLS